MAYLSVISNPDDSVSLERIINVPSEASATHRSRSSRITRAGGGSRCTQRSRRPTRPALRVAAKACRGLLDLFEGLRVAAREVSPAESIGAVLDESGYRKELEAEDTVEAESRLENLEELINASGSTSASSPSRRLKASCRNKPFILIRTLTSEGGRVTMMTLHNTKGLEFGHVYVVGMEEGLSHTPVRSTNTTSKRNGGSPTSASHAPGRRSRSPTPGCAPAGASASTGCHHASSPRSQTSTSRARYQVFNASGRGGWGVALSGRGGSGRAAQEG